MRGQGVFDVVDVGCKVHAVGVKPEVQVVDVVMPTSYIGLHSTDDFNNAVAAALYKGCKVRLIAPEGVDVRGQDYLLLVQPAMRAAVYRDLGDSPSIKHLNRYATSILAGPIMLRNYFFNTDENNVVTVTGDTTCDSGWAVLMRLRGIKMGSIEELRAARSAVLRPLVEPEGFKSFGDELILANRLAELRVPAVQSIKPDSCSCLASRLCELVGRLPLLGAKNLRDVVTGLDFMQASLFMHVSWRAMSVVLDHGVLKCVEYDPSGVGTVIKALDNLCGLPDHMLDAPLWCGDCRVYDTVHTSDGLGLACGDCGSRDRVLPQHEHSYDDLLSDVGMHFVINDRTMRGRDAFERDKHKIYMMLCLDNTPYKDMYVNGKPVLAAFMDIMSEEGKYVHCVHRLKPPEQYARRCKEAWTNRFDYAYTGLFRARFLVSVFNELGYRGPWFGEVLAVSHLKRTCMYCGGRSDIGLHDMVDAVLDRLGSTMRGLCPDTATAELWMAWYRSITPSYDVNTYDGPPLYQLRVPYDIMAKVHGCPVGQVHKLPAYVSGVFGVGGVDVRYTFDRKLVQVDVMAHLDGSDFSDQDDDIGDKVLSDGYKLGYDVDSYVRELVEHCSHTLTRLAA